MENNTLAHHGILGMKWGVRRFQTKSGKLTKAGKKRYGDSPYAKSKKKKTTPEETKPKKKTIGEMSDDELIKAIERARLEQTYRTLVPEKVSAGKQFAQQFVDKAIKPAVVASGERFLKNALDKVADKALKNKLDPNSIEALKKQAEKLELKNKISDLKNKSSDSISELKKIAETLELKNKISKLENDEDPNINWSDKIKQQTYERLEKEKELADREREIKLAKAEYDYEQWLKSIKKEEEEE